jgi:hypothetical protein
LPPLSVRGPPGLCACAARNTVPALYAWEPPSPRVRCLLACFTYLLTLGFARGRRSGGPGRTGARAPGAPLLSPRRSAGHKTPQEASLIYIIESSRAFPPSGDPARCAYGKGRT